MSLPSIFVISEDTGLLSELCVGARPLGEKLTAVMFGDKAAADAASCGADRLIYCPVDNDGAPEDYAGAIAVEIKKNSGAFVILGNSIRGRALAGLIGAALDTAVLTSVSELTPEGDTLICRRTVYGGTAQSSAVFTTPYAVVTVGGGIFGESTAALPPTADISAISGNPVRKIKRISRSDKLESAANLAGAKRIVDVGRGLAEEADLDMCRKLASALDAAMGCSRPVAENNKWLPKSVYLGITGVQVKPDLCFALGVSGQVQHIAGINKSKVIVAINKDKNAPIFKNADFGLVGDMYKIVPELIKQLS